MGILAKIFGDVSSKEIKQLRPLCDAVNGAEGAIQALSDEALRGKTDEFRKRLKDGASLDDISAEAFAVVREASRRTLGQRHYDVQLIGGFVLHRGKIAEMRTGEGKTLVATLPVYLNALAGKGAHVVTVNDYLSRRDGAWMGEIYSFLGLSVGVINHEASYLYDPTHTEKDKERDALGSFRVVHEFLRPCTRREAYAADITYGTNNEFGFDYLRDNLAYRPDQLVQREHYFAVVDEVDSILIDEARTPLIISAPVADAEKLYTQFALIASQLSLGEDYARDEKRKEIMMTEAGIDHAEHLLGVKNIYTDKGVKYVHHLETAVRAKEFYLRDKEYVVKDGNIVIVDEFTGRMQPGRRWSDGLHQAIEAKEGVKIQQESRTYASVSYQNYFRLYAKLCGMTGTALTSSEEFLKVYNLDTIAIPPNRPVQRNDQDDLIYQTEMGKFKAVARRIKELSDNGQPVLVGTISIEKNELLSALLRAEGIQHQVLNAKNHEREGEIIAQAGRKGAVTIATNMAGRGVDIILGGNPPDKNAQEEIRGRGGLVVIGTERHEARRIDNQLRGRSGRQGDPGLTQFFVSLEDELMRVFASDTIKTMMGKFGIPEDEPIQNRLVTRSLESAQAKIEGLNFDMRKHLLDYDDVMNRQRKGIYARRRAILTGGAEDVDAFIEEAIVGRDDEAKLRETIAKHRATLGEVQFVERTRMLALQIIDMLWVEHLETMEALRESVRLRSYGQRDPLVEYKREGVQMYQQLEVALFDNFVKMFAAVEEGALREERPQSLEEVKESAETLAKGNETKGTVHKVNEPGRNDPCPCGSGKKYKKCHGK